jgi:hypothetical protein
MIMSARAVHATAWTLLILLLLAAPANAQHEHHPAAPDSGWSWSAESSVFMTGNFQVREFRDFHQLESQNWVMGGATRKAGSGTLTLQGMFSLEPFTLRELGSAQAFQTGETLDGAPLIDYQHPHDLVMGLSAGYERPVASATWTLRGGLVDSPALGPTAFMHRASAQLHPTAPLGHHQLDSTHITHGVVTTGLRRGVWQAEASAFRGREPDEDRIRLDMGPLDSLAVRGSWRTVTTTAQVSIGWLDDPHVSEPGDVTRITASVEHDGTWRARALAFTLAWGQNRGQFSNEDALLGEAALGVGPRGTSYVRAELVDKHILEAGGLHPVGLEHPHVLSAVKALTLGYQHDVWRHLQQRLAIGADVTGHLTPANLASAYGRPLSIHVYGRWTVRYPDPPYQEVR